MLVEAEFVVCIDGGGEEPVSLLETGTSVETEMFVVVVLVAASDSTDPILVNAAGGRYCVKRNGWSERHEATRVRAGMGVA